MVISKQKKEYNRGAGTSPIDISPARVTYSIGGVPSIIARVINNMGEIIRVKVKDVNFVSYNGEHHCIEVIERADYAPKKEIEILPGLSREIEYILPDTVDNSRKFKKKDVVITTFNLNGTIIPRGFRMAEISCLGKPAPGGCAKILLVLIIVIFIVYMLG